jgi:hypothetical protein
MDYAKIVETGRELCRLYEQQIAAMDRVRGKVADLTQAELDEYDRTQERIQELRYELGKLVQAAA